MEKNNPKCLPFKSTVIQIPVSYSIARELERSQINRTIEGKLHKELKQQTTNSKAIFEEKSSPQANLKNDEVRPFLTFGKLPFFRHIVFAS